MHSDLKYELFHDDILDFEEYAVIPSKDIVPFPNMIIPIGIDNSNMIRIVEDAHSEGNLIFVLVKKNQKLDDLAKSSYYEAGCIGKVMQILKIPGMGVKAIIQVLRRAKVLNFSVKENVLYSKISLIDINFEPDEMIEASLRIIKKLYKNYLDLNQKNFDDNLQAFGSETKDPLMKVDDILGHLDLSLEQKQKLLEISEFSELLDQLHIILINEIEFAKLENKIELKVNNKVMKEQKEYFLKEKIKGMKSEINADESDIDEVDKIKELIKQDKLSIQAKKKAEVEIEKLKRIHSMSPEYGLIRDFLDLLGNLPWKEKTAEKIDILEAEKILDEDHYGLNKAKERILEYLSVLKLVKKIKGPILCLVGPPGTGKTSLGRSVARALNREYIRVALGGLHDEAEIRGHRRTYIGAMPGKIIQSIKKCGVNNPLFLLDEIDKLTSDFRGDPASALLEVLDPEQNNSFMDNYLDVEFDLSSILFIATANDKSRIPKPLLDRMELIEIDGYLDVEKYHIATDFLIQKQFKENGITAANLTIDDEAIYKIISDYTLEAGVRELERKIAKICRKVAKEIIKDSRQKIEITKDNLEKYLGIARFVENVDNHGLKVGEVNGLAWTNAGGSILKVETNIMEGKKDLSLTGKLGDVMKESAQVALSYIRSNAKAFEIDNEFFEKNEIHLHFPEGAVPKDGPSAGITIVTSILSAIKNLKVDQSVAMTGEVTIHGDVLAIGGLNAKLMAAKRSKIKKVIIPLRNEKDLKEIAEEILESFEVIKVKHVKEVIEEVLYVKN